MDRSQSIQKIENLIQNFRSEKGEKLNEAETRLRFIDPFFEALGWNIRNPREVRIESALVRSDSTRPDYRFLIEGKTKFFVEAKKPSVKLTDPLPVFQAKSYGFSSKVPIVILTDFEEFRPFRTLARPKYDRPLDGLIKEYDLTYENYLEKFDPLYDTFSHDAVFAGELEKRIPTEKKEASATVDKEFLKDLSNWQEELAKNIALRNSKLSVSEINEAVQRILDRIIFLRICEDRQIEESKILLSYAEKESIYRNLLKEFTRLRSKYNGLIFNEHRLSEQLSIDDKLLKDIIKNLYLPYSPYRFNEIPIEILGTIYEQYLGKVITLTPTHRAKVEVKPEVRKAGGIFYTPQFITSYIIKNTIGKLLQPCEPCEGSPQTATETAVRKDGGQVKPSQGLPGLTPQQIAKLKFADIACGSGSFLLEMFDYLIRYHIDYYSAHTDKIKTTDGIPDAYQTPDGLWHLSTRKKKEILINNIYGVDIDPQAVEVTQMSLYLKLLEGENAESFDKQLSLDLKETILPTLSNNIKCGNSLVGMDIKGLGNNLTLEEELRIRPFDWETAFPEVMNPSTSLRRERSGGGFDAIVGNPPYVRPHNIEVYAKEYYWKHYESFVKKSDLYCCFMQRAIELTRNEGFVSFIVSDGWLRLDSFEEVRKYALKNCMVLALVNLPDKVFADATVRTGIFLFKKNINESRRSKTIIDIIECDNQIKSFVKKREISQEIFYKTYKNVFDTSLSKEMLKFKSSVEKNSAYLGTLLDIRFGLKTGDDSKFIQRKKETDNHKPLLRGENIQRYVLEFKGEYVWYVPGKMRTHRSTARPGESGRFEQPKILIKDTSTKLGGTFDSEHYYVKDVLILTKKEGINTSLKFILGILNSLLMRFYYRSTFPTLHVQNEELSTLPIRTIDFNNPDEKSMHDRMVQLVERMLDLHKKKQQSNADSERELFEHQIKATDKEIDQLVYKLYNITDEEQKIIESN